MADKSDNMPDAVMVTPYWREERGLIERCIASVAAQSVPTEHLLVADGEPAAWIDDMPVRHVVLDRTHGNYGNTPRAIGLMAAIASGYRAIGLLDADNCIDADHVSTCLDAARDFPQADYVIARRRFVDMGGQVMPLRDEPVEEHVDTSCFMFLPGSFWALPTWGLIPDRCAAIADRIFYASLRAKGLIAVCTARTTVSYRVSIADLYVQAGLPVPHGAKPRHDILGIATWLSGLDQAGLDDVQRRCGVRMEAIVPPSHGRNSKTVG